MLSVWGVLWSLVFAPLAAAGSKEALYLRATDLYQKKQFKQAVPLLEQSLRLFGKAQVQQRPGTRPWHQLSLAQSDILARLAAIAWRSGDKRRSCRLYQRVYVLHKTLPPQWKLWTAHTTLPRRIQAALRQVQTLCVQVPALVVVEVTPKIAKLAVQRSPKGWVAVRGRDVRTTRSVVRIRVTAPGYLPQRLVVKQIPRWGRVKQRVTLQPRPKPQVRPRLRLTTRPPVTPRKPLAAIRPRPLPRRLAPPPFFKTWWFWTVAGVVVVGGTSALIIAATIQPDYVLQGASKDKPHKIW